jgi:leucyl aminopeptidase
MAESAGRRRWPPWHQPAREVGALSGLRVEVFDRDALVALGCGGLLGVSTGSTQPPRMIRLRYEPDGVPTGRLTRSCPVSPRR